MPSTFFSFFIHQHYLWNEMTLSLTTWLHSADWWLLAPWHGFAPFCHSNTVDSVLKLFFTLQPSGRTVANFWIHIPTFNWRSIFSPQYNFSRTTIFASFSECPFIPKWWLIGFSRLSFISLRCSVILACNSRSVSPTYTTDWHTLHIIPYIILRMRQVTSVTGL